MRHPKLTFLGGLFARRDLAAGEDRRETGFKVEKVCGSCRKHRRGAAAVEFAIVAPVFFLMILGMIELGRAVMVQQIITNASREGARLAVLPGTTGADVTTRVDEILAASTVSGATVKILDASGADTNPETAQYGDTIKVTVSVPFSEVSWLPTSKFLSGRILTASTVMRTERVQ